MCGVRAAAEDGKTVARGLKKWLDIGGRLLLVTRTNPHLSSDSAAHLFATHREAESKYKSGKSWQLLTNRLEIQGAERALEVTYSLNGWHMHTHEVLFIKPGSHVTLEKVQQELAKRWNRVCIAAGIGPISSEYGVDVDEINDHIAAKKVAAYIAKELTGWSNKVSRYGSLAPLDLLRVIDQAPTPAATSAARQLFGEFATAIKGRRRLVPSGIARKLRIDEDTEGQDEGKVEDQNDDEVTRELLAWITKLGWSGVVKHCLRGELTLCTTSEQVVAVVMRANPGTDPRALVEVPGHEVLAIGEGKFAILRTSSVAPPALPLKTLQHAPPRPPGPRPPGQDAGILARTAPR